MSSLIYKGDIGAQIIADTENITAATTTTFTLIVEKPSGATVEWAGTMDYATGLLTYTTLTGDIDESGQHVAQVRSVSATGTEKLKSDTDTFTIYEPIF